MTSQSTLHCEVICYPELPLAVYREIAAHCQQVNTVDAQLMPPQQKKFAYEASQVSGLQLVYPTPLAASEKQHLDAILDFYAQRYGSPSRQLGDRLLSAKP